MQTVERALSRAALALAAVFFLGAASSLSAQTQGRVPGFRPSRSGFKFTNNFPSMPYGTINVVGFQVGIGDASNGMCGGMVYAVRDYHEAGLPPPPNAAPPAGGTLFNHLSQRLFDSFNLPNGPAKYIHLMNPDLPDHETDFSRLGLLPHGRAWVTIVEEWPRIKADLDGGRLSPMALVRVKTHDPFQMGQNHQVLAYAYVLSGTHLKIYIYDPNYPGNDKVTLSLSIADPQHTTAMTQSTGEALWAFFRTDYWPSYAPGYTVAASKLTGDFNADGRTDIALTGRAGWGSLPVAFGTSYGGFNVTNTAITDFASWSSDRNARKLTGDFNGDGRTDIALSGPGYWNTLPTAFSNGDGSFYVTNSYVGNFAAWSSNREAERLVGDFNGDGRDDIALTGAPGWQSVPVAFSNGNGTYSVTNSWIGDFAGWSSDIEAKRLVGDFNGDGRDDIALTGQSAWNTLPIAFSNGNGSFYVTNYYIGDFAAWSSNPQATRLVGDFNGDGRADVALSGPAGWPALPVAFSNGGGGFYVTNATSPYIATYGASLTRRAIHSNGDALSDISVGPVPNVPGTQNGGYVIVGVSNGDGTFNESYQDLGVTFGNWLLDPQVQVLAGNFGGGGTGFALYGPGWWQTIPVARWSGSAFIVTNAYVGDFAAWASEPIL